MRALAQRHLGNLEGTWSCFDCFLSPFLSCPEQMLLFFIGPKPYSLGLSALLGVFVSVSLSSTAVKHIMARSQYTLTPTHPHCPSV